MLNPFISKAGRLRNGWWIALFFAVLAALLVPLIVRAHDGAGAVPLWQQALIVVAASLICQALRRRPIAELVGALNRRWPRDLAIGVGLGAALMAAPALLLAAVGAVRWSVNGADALLGAAALYALVAVTEEALFRGFIFQRFIDGLGVWPAQVIVAALFTLTHADALAGAGALGALAGANIFVASWMFGWAFIRTRSLAMPLGIHFAANFVQGGVLGFGVSGNEAPGLLTPALTGPAWLTGGAFGLEASVPGFVCVTALALLLYRWRGADQAKRQ